MQVGERSHESPPAELRDQLAALGLQPGTPASEADLKAAQDATGAVFATEWRSLYRAMDGAFDGGTACWVTLWPLSEIVSEKDSVQLPEGYLAFADHSIHAEVFAADFRDMTKPVIEAFTLEQVSPSAREFLRELSVGNLKFFQH